MVLTVERNDRDDEANGQHHDNEGIDLETWRFIRVELCMIVSALFLSIGASPSFYPFQGLCNILSIVLLLPPAPAALVLDGRWFASLSCLSAAAFLLIIVAGPPGALGDAGRAVVEPVVACVSGEEGRGDDCAKGSVSLWYLSPMAIQVCAIDKSQGTV